MTPEQQLERLAEAQRYGRDTSEFECAVNALKPTAILADYRAMRDLLDAALKECGEWARKAGLAEGKLKASEIAGVVEGWQARAEAAEAIVAKLPKTADDVPVVPGMTVYDADGDGCSAGIDYTGSLLDQWNYSPGWPIYSTREAALAAKEADHDV